MREHFVLQTGAFERWMPEMYLCPAGQLTIGYGHNLERYGADKDELECLFSGHSMSLMNGLKLLEIDMQDAIEDAVEYFPRLAELSENRQYVIIDMCFNMGRNTIRTFVNTKRLLALAIDGKAAFADVGDEMVNSRWFRQTGTRAEFLVNLMSNDIWRGVEPVD